jgi:hypothetical protein
VHDVAVAVELALNAPPGAILGSDLSAGEVEGRS